jgi:dTDP-4-dehydrorhamnose 3,5-epimerase-like enzyme
MTIKMKKKLQLIKLNYYKDKRGLLTPFEFKNKKIKINNSLLFNVKRLFFVVGNKDYFRGNHAHKKCSQILICLNGKIKIKTKYKNNSKSFQISNKKGEALFIPPMVWNRIYFINKNSSLAVLCDYKYDFKKEYINDYKEFKKLSSRL